MWPFCWLICGDFSTPQAQSAPTPAVWAVYPNRPVHKLVSPSPPDLCRNISNLLHKLIVAAPHVGYAPNLLAAASLPKKDGELRVCMKPCELVCLNGFDDPTTNFLVQRAVMGIRRGLNNRISVSLFLIIIILGRLAYALSYCSTVGFRTVMFKSIFLLASFAFPPDRTNHPSNVKAGSVRNILTFNSCILASGVDLSLSYLWAL